VWIRFCLITLNFCTYKDSKISLKPKINFGLINILCLHESLHIQEHFFQGLGIENFISSV